MSKKQTGQFPLATYTDELAGRLRSLVPAALQDGEVDAIHQARVTTRRLRAALDLLNPVMPAKMRKAVAKTLKRLRKQLGPLRDADVMLGHLKEFRRFTKHAAAIEWLNKHLTTRREEAAKEALAEAPPAKTLGKLGVWWGVREEIAGARDEVDALLAASLHKQIADFAAAADSLVAAQNSSETPPADPHVVRIAGKLLRYTVEMAAVEGHELPPTVLRSFKKMQDALGNWHDYVVLTETAMEISVDELLPAHDAALQRRVLSFAELSLRRSQIYLGKFAELWKERGGAISQAIREAFPETITEPKTDRDPPGSAVLPAPAASASNDPAPA